MNVMRMACTFFPIIGALAVGIASKAQTAWGCVPTNAFPGLMFSNPTCMTAPPGETNRLFLLEKHGRIIVITNLAAPARTIFMDISDRVTPVIPGSESADVNNEQGLLGLAFHPGCATNGSGGLRLHDILSRFQISSLNTNQGDPNSETQLTVQYDRAGNFSGVTARRFSGIVIL